MSWQPPEDHTRRYRLCRLGFALIALASGVMMLDSAGHVALLLSFERDLFALVNGPVWVWFASSTIVGSGLIASCLLWSCWDVPEWRRRANGLLMISLAGLGLWVVRHGVTLGVLETEAPWPAVRNHLNFVLRLLWIWTATAMASDVALHLERADAQEARATLNTLTLATLTVWALMVLYELNGLGRGRIRFTPLYWLLFLGTAGLRGLTSFFLTVLALLTAREAGVLVRQLQAAERGDDLFGPEGTSRP